MTCLTEAEALEQANGIVSTHGRGEAVVHFTTTQEDVHPESVLNVTPKLVGVTVPGWDLQTLEGIAHTTAAVQLPMLVRKLYAGGFQVTKLECVGAAKAIQKPGTSEAERTLAQVMEELMAAWGIQPQRNRPRADQHIFEYPLHTNPRIVLGGGLDMAPDDIGRDVDAPRHDRWLPPGERATTPPPVRLEDARGEQLAQWEDFLLGNRNAFDRPAQQNTENLPNAFARGPNPPRPILNDVVELTLNHALRDRNAVAEVIARQGDLRRALGLTATAALLEVFEGFADQRRRNRAGRRQRLDDAIREDEERNRTNRRADI